MFNVTVEPAILWTHENNDTHIATCVPNALVPTEKLSI